MHQRRAGSRTHNHNHHVPKHAVASDALHHHGRAHHDLLRSGLENLMELTDGNLSIHDLLALGITRAAPELVSRIVPPRRSRLNRLGTAFWADLLWTGRHHRLQLLHHAQPPLRSALWPRRFFSPGCGCNYGYSAHVGNTSAKSCSTKAPASPSKGFSDCSKVTFPRNSSTTPGWNLFICESV